MPLKIIQILSCQAGGASHRAGVREGDVIIKVNGQQVSGTVNLVLET